MAKFEKGHGGLKPKGVPNKKTQEQLKRIEYVLGLLDETIDKDIKALKEIERARLWADLQEYIRPKLARTEHTGKDGEPITVNFKKGEKHND